MKKNMILAVILVSQIGLLGCGSSSGPAGDRRYFLLEIQRQGQTLNPQGDGILMVRPFSLAPGYHARELTYRTGEFQYESDYYNQFITEVGQQIAEQTRAWFSQSGYFSHVVPPGSTLNATHVLEGNITRLYGDFRDKSNAKAFVSITFYLMDVAKRQPNIVLSVPLDAQAPVAEASAESLVKAYQTCLQEILQQLEKELKK